MATPARWALVAMVVTALALGAMPGAAASPAHPIPVAAREVSVALDGVRVVELPMKASHVALHWRGHPDAGLVVAFSVDGVLFDTPIAVEPDEVGEQRGNGETYGAVTYSGAARFVRITADRPIARVTVLALDSTGWAVSAPGFGPASAAGAVSQPTVITRAGWGADESLRFNADGSEKWTPAFYPVQKLIVHHTAGSNADPNPAATIRSIYYYHAITQGWGDIGYNFLIDEAGRVYEGRSSRPYAPGESPTGEDLNGNGVTAAHAQGFNSGTVGIALLGTLSTVDATAAARSTMERMLAWKADRHGIDPFGSSLFINPVNGTQKVFPNISGHRDVNATECPGGYFYGTLPALRTAVAALMAPPPTPAPTLTPTPQPTVLGTPSAPLNVLAAPHKVRGIVVSWSAGTSDGGTPVTGYRIYRSTAAGTEAFYAAVGLVTSYRDTATKKGVKYWYRVAAVNAVGTGPLSGESSAVAK